LHTLTNFTISALFEYLLKVEFSGFSSYVSKFYLSTKGKTLFPKTRKLDIFLILMIVYIVIYDFPVGSSLQFNINIFSSLSTTEHGKISLKSAKGLLKGFGSIGALLL
jgi:hypothetical protein